ncbi:MAG: hypothetical protein AAB426_00735 [Myxococcota bacterium]
MLLLLSAIIAVLPASADESPTAVARACVRVAAGPTAYLVSQDSLVDALRARLGQRGVLVVDCATATGAEDWRVGVETVEPTTLELSIDGPQIAMRHRVMTAGRAPEAVVQLLAVGIAEALRPTLDALLARLGKAPLADDGLDDALAHMATTEPPKVSTVEPTPTGLAPPGRLRNVLGLGAGFNPDVPRLQPFASLALEKQTGRVALRLHTSASGAPSTRVQSWRVAVVQYRVGGSVAWSSPFADVGLGAQARYSQISLASAADPTLVRAPATAWDAGPFAIAAVWPLTTGRWQLGVCTQVSLWWHPLRLRVRGQAVMHQSFVDAELGPVVRWLWR